MGYISPGYETGHFIVAGVTGLFTEPDTLKEMHDEGITRVGPLKRKKWSEEMERKNNLACIRAFNLQRRKF